MNQLKEELETELNRLFDVNVTLETPNNLDYGDYATPAALAEANEKGEQPREYAEQIVEQFPMSEYSYIDDISVAGQGYINIRLNRERLGAEILSTTAEPPFGNRDEKIVVEHTSPNPNKPLHMGTMRCAILGDSVARIADYLGYDVEVQNYINDLGRQSATTVYAYKNFLDELSEEDQEKKADYWIGVLYSKASQYLEEHPDDDEQVQQIIQDIERQDNENFDLMTDIVEKSLRGQIDTAHRSNVYYDLIEFESDVVDSGLFERAMDLLRDLDKVYEVKEGDDKGCIVIDMSDYTDELGEMEKPYKILVRSDGTATYTAKDIALTLWKFGVISSVFNYMEFGTRPDEESYWRTGGDEEMVFGDADRVINVIGRPQKFLMKVLESALRALEFEEEANNFNHLDFKFVYLTGDALPGDTEKEKVAYSGRKGNWRGKHGDAVLEKAKDLASEEIEDRHPKKPPEQVEEIAEKVAVAAIRYYLLRFTRKKEIEFSFDKVMDWEGDSGPYLLYSTVRAYSILHGIDLDPEFLTYEHDVEIRLLHELDRFPSIVVESFEIQDPAKLTHYLRNLAEVFNSFYHKCPVQQADTEELRRSRIALTEGFVDIMEEGMDLLGIEPVEEL